jgi:serine/threonine-protein kinase
MQLPERFGKFVLVEQLDVGSLGDDFRAIAPGELATFSFLQRVDPELVREEEVLRRLVAEVKTSAQLANPNILRVQGIGKVQDTYFIAYPWMEGKSLKAIFRKSRRERVPFRPDHALWIASKIARGLEYCHARKIDGHRYSHGSLIPSNALLTYEGEVRLRGFAFWPALRERARHRKRWGPEELLYLAPEQVERFEADFRSDLFALGLNLFEMLTGVPYFENGRQVDYPARIRSARMPLPGESAPFPTGVEQLLKLLLAPEPDRRLDEVGEARARLEKMVFTGDFQPTTFNLAFFMHTLFREEIEQEIRDRKSERERDYSSLFPDARPAPTPAKPSVESGPPSFQIARPEGQRDTAPPAAAPATTDREPAVAAAADHAVPAAVAAGEPPRRPRPSGSGAFRRSEPTSPLEPVPRVEFFEAVPTVSPGRRRWRTMVVVLVLLGGGAAIAYQFLMPRWARSALSGDVDVTPPPLPEVADPDLEPSPLMAPGPEVLPVPADLEERLEALRQEMADELQRAVAAERQRLQQEFDGRQEARIIEEMRRREAALEERFRMRELEERRRIEGGMAAQNQASPRPAAPPASTSLGSFGAPAATAPLLPEEGPPDAGTLIAPPPSAGVNPPAGSATTTIEPPVTPGQLVDVSDPELVPPEPLERTLPEYPPLAARQRAEASVVVSALVSEKGEVLETRVIRRQGAARLGFEAAAQRAVSRYKFRPATKRGVSVRTWFNVVVRFTL